MMPGHHPTRFEVRLGERGYPRLLAEAPDPPAVIYGLGAPSVLVPSLGVVGARRATPYGLQVASHLTGWAARAGCVIVSGGAIGCDQAAHRSALAAGGTTVAVMGCGADIVYPSGAGAVLDDIAHSGAVISEHPWGTQPKRWTFRTRNRIIAGLSAALLVVEAGLGSGTFSTADYALAAGRDVLAVPGSIFSPECAGSNRLIRQGATPVTDASELKDALDGLLDTTGLVPDAWHPASASSDDPLVRAIRAMPMRPDDLARALAYDIVSVSRRLGVLEAAGLVVRYRDGRYGPC